MLGHEGTYEDTLGRSLEEINMRTVMDRTKRTFFSVNHNERQNENAKSHLFGRRSQPNGLFGQLQDARNN